MLFLFFLLTISFYKKRKLLPTFRQFFQFNDYLLFTFIEIVKNTKLLKVTSHNIPTLFWLVEPIIVTLCLVEGRKHRFITLFLLLIQRNTFALLLYDNFGRFNIDIYRLGTTLELDWFLHFNDISGFFYAKDILQQIFPKGFVVLTFFPPSLPLLDKELCVSCYFRRIVHRL